MLRHGVQPTQVYDSDSALEGHDDEQERQEPPKTAQQTRVGAISACFELGVVRCSTSVLSVLFTRNKSFSSFVPADEQDQILQNQNCVNFCLDW